MNGCLSLIMLFERGYRLEEPVAGHLFFLTIEDWLTFSCSTAGKNGVTHGGQTEITPWFYRRADGDAASDNIDVLMWGVEDCTDYMSPKQQQCQVKRPALRVNFQLKKMPLQIKRNCKHINFRHRLLSAQNNACCILNISGHFVWVPVHYTTHCIVSEARWVDRIAC